MCCTELFIIRLFLVTHPFFSHFALFLTWSMADSKKQADTVSVYNNQGDAVPKDQFWKIIKQQSPGVYSFISFFVHIFQLILFCVIQMDIQTATEMSIRFENLHSVYVSDHFHFQGMIIQIIQIIQIINKIQITQIETQIIFQIHQQTML